MAGFEREKHGTPGAVGVEIKFTIMRLVCALLATSRQTDRSLCCKEKGMESSSPTIRVVQNWFAEFKDRQRD